jgi:sterol desaturase/sphingolipid hydroxylase (fatty acid hydroxylase superfamily)
MSYGDLFVSSFGDYWRYLLGEITHPTGTSYFYGLILVSLAVFALELVAPWRREQPRLRRDFWLDAFYMFFNFFLFSLIGFFAVSNVVVHAFRDLLRSVFGLENLVALEIASWPLWLQLVVLFVLRDFIHWNVHRLLHRSEWLWQFHKVHHSVTQMGFAAHLRYHWMENVVYRVLEYVPLALIGFGIADYFAVHMLALTIGHFTHANLKVPLGPLKYVLNNPQMHIWHHARSLPRRYGANFGISLSLWDYVLGTAVVPGDGRDVELGFDDVESFPKGFLGQQAYPLFKPRPPGAPRSLEHPSTHAS